MHKLGAILRCCFALALMLCQSCATNGINAARANFHLGRFEAAEKSLAEAKVSDKDRVLFFMERGVVRQNAGMYKESAADFNAANLAIEELRTYSISKGAASWVANDQMLSFGGVPFERTLLHAFAAKSYLALGIWDGAAVEARLIDKSLDKEFRDDFPEDAYSRYMAGFCFEMVGDWSGAEFQYRKAAELAEKKGIYIDSKSGSVTLDKETTQDKKPNVQRGELICFVGYGNVPGGRDILANRWPATYSVHAEVYAGEKYLGRSFVLADTAELSFETEQKLAAMKALKTIARIAAKESIAGAIESRNQVLADLARLLLIGILEQPDCRRWETLPRFLSVARIPYSPSDGDLELRFVSIPGVAIKCINLPVQEFVRYNKRVAFARDIVAADGLDK